MEAERRAHARLARAVAIAASPYLVLSVTSGYFWHVLRQRPTLFWLFDVFRFVVLPSLTLIWLAKARRVGPGRYGLASTNRENVIHLILSVMALTFVLHIVLLLSDSLVAVVLNQSFTRSRYEDLITDGPLRVPVIAYLALSAGIVEEIFFRGLPLLYVESRFAVLPLAAYVLGTSSVFAVCHLGHGWQDFVAALAYGLVASALYVRLRNLWPLVGSHVLVDLWHIL